MGIPWESLGSEDDCIKCAGNSHSPLEANDKEEHLTWILALEGDNVEVLCDLFLQHVPLAALLLGPLVLYQLTRWHRVAAGAKHFHYHLDNYNFSEH